MATLTVFTPTYNRREYLKRVYDSLLRQSSKDFLWLIVDDGSNDGSGELIRSFEAEKKLKIVYKYFENGGKMRAHNRGVELCDTELFVCLDSDDYFVEDGVKRILECYEDIKRDPDTDPERVAGIAAYKGESDDRVLYDTHFPRIDHSSLFSLYLKGFKGETTLIYKTKILKEYPFPEIEGEKYVPEDYIYDKIDLKYVLKILPEIITVCEIVSEGYTDSVKKLKRDNPTAFYLYYEQRTRLAPVSLLKFKYAGFFVIYAIRSKNRLLKAGSVNIFWVILGFISAFLIRITKKE
ncbi:MAG: glycosyltransferase family 2 protein [Lachnospiraceae bacterium]|nr:glycosyltransferase family 2 protein [Lachnospiraceae bacterium]